MAANQEQLSRHEGGAGKVGIAPDLHCETFANGDVVLSEHSGNSSADYSVVLESFYQNCFELDN